MFALANERIRFPVDGSGNMTELRGLSSGQNHVGGEGLWRIIYQHDEVQEEVVLTESCHPEITAGKEEILMVWPQVVSEAGAVAFRLEIRAFLREFQFLVKNIQLKPEQQVYWSYGGGGNGSKAFPQPSGETSYGPII